MSVRSIALLLLLLTHTLYAGESGPQLDPLPAGALARLGSVQDCHPSADGMRLAADGKSLITFRNNGECIAWNAATGNRLWENTLPVGVESLLWISDDGSNAAFANGDTITIAQTKTGKILHTLTVPGGTSMQAFAFGPDGKSAASVQATGEGHRFLHVWDMASDKARSLAAFGRPVMSLAFARGGRDLFVGGTYSLVCLDAASGEERWSGNAAGERWSISSNGDKISVVRSGLNRGRVEWYNIADGSKLGERDCDEGRRGNRNLIPGFSADGEWLCYADLKNVNIWDTVHSSLILTIPNESFRAAVIALDKKTLYTLSSLTGRLQAWDIPTGKPRYVDVLSRRHAAQVTLLAWSPDGRRLATVAARDPRVLVWDDAGNLLHILKDSDVQDLRFRPDGRLLTLIADGSVRCWDLAGTPKAERLQGQVHTGLGLYGKFLNDRRAVAVGVDSWVHIDPEPGDRVVIRSSLLDFRKGREASMYVQECLVPSAQAPNLTPYGAFINEARFRFNGGPLPSLQKPDQLASLQTHRVSPDGLLVLATPQDESGSRGGTYPATVFERLTGRRFPLNHYERPRTSFTFSDDSRLLIVEGVGLHFFDALSGVEYTAGELPRFKEPKWYARIRGFSPDGRRVAIAYSDYTVVIWETERFFHRPPDPERDLQSLWEDLCDEDPAKGVRACRMLIDRPVEGLKLLREKVRPALLPADLAARIRDLDSPRFRVREAASRSLRGVGSIAYPALNQARKDPPSEEAAARLDALLQTSAFTAPSEGEEMRLLRCVGVLERIGNADAFALLRKLAGGVACRVTIEAADALERLGSED